MPAIAYVGPEPLDVTQRQRALRGDHSRSEHAPGESGIATHGSPAPTAVSSTPASMIGTT
jgi:hypothetical protein